MLKKRPRTLRGTSEVSSGPDNGQRREAVRRLLTIGVVLAGTAIVALVLHSCQPTVHASLETDLPDASGMVVLHGARATRPVTAELESFSLIRGGARIAADQEEVTFRIPVSRRDCPRLAAEVGGGCDGEAAPPLRTGGNLKFQAANQPFSVSVVPDDAPRLQLMQGGERAHNGAPVAWVLASNAARTLVEFECEPATPLAITLSPPQAMVVCEPGASSYELVVVNDAAVSSALSLTRVHSFDAGFQSDRASIDARGGTLKVDEDEEGVRRSEVTPVEIVPAGSDAVGVEITAPTANDASETWLRSSRAAQVLKDETDQVPTRLAQQKEWMPVWIALLVGIALDALVFLITIRRN